jgi:hypothetical protein
MLDESMRRGSSLKAAFLFAQKKNHIMSKKPPADLRGRIRGLRLIRVLERHVLDGLELRPSQITAALALLKKILPDLGSADAVPGTTHEDALKDLE